MVPSATAAIFWDAEEKIEELQKTSNRHWKKTGKNCSWKSMKTAKRRNGHRETVVILKEKLQKAYVPQNTARMEIRQMEEKREEIQRRA